MSVVFALARNPACSSSIPQSSSLDLRMRPATILRQQRSRPLTNSRTFPRSAKSQPQPRPPRPTAFSLAPSAPWSVGRSRAGATTSTPPAPRPMGCRVLIDCDIAICNNFACSFSSSDHRIRRQQRRLAAALRRCGAAGRKPTALTVINGEKSRCVAHPGKERVARAPHARPPSHPVVISNPSKSPFSRHAASSALNAFSPGPYDSPARPPGAPSPTLPSWL